MLGLEALAARPRAARALRAFLIAFAAACAAYGVIALRVRDFFGAPLTWPMLRLGLDLGNMRASIVDAVSPGWIAALLAAPGLVVLATLTAPAGERRSRIAAPGIAALLLAGLLASSGDVLGPIHRGLARSAHLVLLSSLARDLTSGGHVQLRAPYGPEELADFEPAPVAAEPPATPPGPPRNVIIVVLESVGAQFLDLFGGPIDATPCLAREAAAQGAVFDAVYAHVGGSSNALFSILFSLYPGLGWRDATLEHPRIAARSLADVLRERGYRTAFVEGGDLDWHGWRALLEGRGFDALTTGRDLGPPLVDSWGVADRLVVDEVLRLADADPTRPFLTVAWPVATHHPYAREPGAPPRDLLRGRIHTGDDERCERYLESIADQDRELGRLFDGLRARGLAERTIVAVIGDHGETFGWPHETWSHGFGVFEEDLRVPFVLWAPGLFAGGARRGTPGGQIDVAPTITALLGISPAPTWQGRNLLDPSRSPRVYTFSASDDYLLAVRDERWKYVLDVTGGHERLFDLASDPGERSDVAEAQPARCDRSRRRLAAWSESTRAMLSRLAGAGR